MSWHDFIQQGLILTFVSSFYKLMSKQLIPRERRNAILSLFLFILDVKVNHGK